MSAVRVGLPYEAESIIYPQVISFLSTKEEILNYLRHRIAEQLTKNLRAGANIESLLKKPVLDALDLEDIFFINADEADTLITLRMVKRRGKYYNVLDTESARVLYESVSQPYEEKLVETPQPTTQPEIPPTRAHPKEEKKAKKPINGKTYPPPDLQNPFQEIGLQNNEKSQRPHYVEGDNGRGYKEKPEKRTSLDRYFEDIEDSTPLTREEEATLSRRIRQDDGIATENLVVANLKVVITVAKEYQNRGLPLEDLIGEGNLGLMYAAQRFDETRNVKFITYAVWWIRQAIRAALTGTARTIRLPVNKVKRLRRIYDAIHKWEQETSQAFTPDRADEIAEKTGLTQRQIREILLASRRELSLDTEYGEDKKETLYAVLPSDQPLPDEQLERKELWENIGDALSTLEKREAEVVRLYFGLENDEPLTLEEIGDRFGLTKERIRQIKGGALKKLKYPKRIRN